MALGAKAKTTNWSKIAALQIQATFHMFLMHFERAVTTTVLPNALQKIITTIKSPNSLVVHPN